MKKFLSKLSPCFLGASVAVGIAVLLYALSWIIAVGIIKLITMCFGLYFSWGTATGLWLVILLLKSIFSHKK